MNQPFSVYHELRKVSPEKARILVRKVLEQNKGNVSKTARILGISRNTVRRARDGNLNDLSRAPKHIPHKTPPYLENLIVEEAKRTGFRYVRLTKYLFRQYGIDISKSTVRAILKRNGVKRKKVRTKSKGTRHLYNYEELEAFEELADGHEDIYRFMKSQIKKAGFGYPALDLKIPRFSTWQPHGESNPDLRTENPMD